MCRTDDKINTYWENDITHEIEAFYGFEDEDETIIEDNDDE